MAPAVAEEARARRTPRRGCPASEPKSCPHLTGTSARARGARAPRARASTAAGTSRSGKRSSIVDACASNRVFSRWSRIECMLFSSARLVGRDERLAARVVRHRAEQLGVHGEVLALVDRLAEEVRARLDVDVVAVADLHRVDAHPLLLREVRRVLGRDDALVRVAVGQQHDGLAARVAPPHAGDGRARPRRRWRSCCCR